MIYDFLKRILDIVGALMGIFLFFPIMLIAAMWIKYISPDGPILADTPMRVGKDKRLFRLLKLRSMIPNAHEILKSNKELYEKYKNNGYKLDPKEDPRIIRGGEFLRKYSIDELPQFFNVLFGEMSIVGPRAYYLSELEEQSEKYPGTKKYINELLTVKPGITGVWQISGRSEIPFDKRVELDAGYAKKRSILYDIFVILKTPYVVITKKGAY